MRIIGLFSILIGTVALVAIFISLNYATHGKELKTNLLIFLCIYFILAILFFKIITITKKRLRVYRPMSFVFKNNQISIEEISKVLVTLNNAGRGGSIAIDIFSKKEDVKISFLTQLFRFEIKRMVRQLQALDVEIELTGSGSL